MTGCRRISEFCDSLQAFEAVHGMHRFHRDPMEWILQVLLLCSLKTTIQAPNAYIQGKNDSKLHGHPQNSTTPDNI